MRPLMGGGGAASVLALGAVMGLGGGACRHSNWGALRARLPGNMIKVRLSPVSVMTGDDCDTKTVSGVTHRSYFQRDLLISTGVTFGHPETGYYIAPLLFPTSL